MQKWLLNVRPVWEIAVHRLSPVISMMVSFCAVFFPRDVLDEILDLTESVSEGFPTYSSIAYNL